MLESTTSYNRVSAFVNNFADHCKTRLTPHIESAINAFKNTPSVDQVQSMGKNLVEYYKNRAMPHIDAAVTECVKYKDQVLEKIPLPVIEVAQEIFNSSMEYHKDLHATVESLSNSDVNDAILSLAAGIGLWCGAGLVYAKATGNSVRTSLVASLTFSTLYTVANQPAVQSLIAPYCSPISLGITLVAVSSLVTWKASPMVETRHRTIVVGGKVERTPVKTKGISLTKAVFTVCSPAVVPAAWYTAQQVITACVNSTLLDAVAV